MALRMDEIKQRLKSLDEMIKETKARLPAHSTKPPVMMDLLALEDEYDLLLEELNTLKRDLPDDGK
jgi:septum formation inhibitor MinC